MMKRFASHYFLRPDGTLGSFPVVEVDEAGVIRSMTEFGRSFTETAAVSFFGGIMLPGFIDFVADGSLFTPGYMRSRSLLGFLRFVCHHGVSGEHDKRIACCPQAIVNAQNIEFGPFDGCLELEALLSQLTYERAHDLDVSPRWGTLQAGSSPGIMILEGLDLKHPKMISVPRFRIIVP